MSTLPLADARAHLSQLVQRAVTTHERFEITRNGRRAAVLLSADDFDAMVETVAVLADPDLMAAYREGRAAAEAGDVLDAQELAEMMREAGRGPT